VRTRPWSGAALAVAALVAAASVEAATQRPCANGRATGVHHAYPECRTSRAGKKVWFVVTDDYYSCPPKGAIVAYRTSEIETAQPCDKPAPRQRDTVTELGPADQSAQEDGEFVFLECVNGFWQRAYYQRHRLADGGVRISHPAKRFENTHVLCDQPRPPLVPGATRAPEAAHSTRTARAPAAGQGGRLRGVVVASRQEKEKRTTLLVATPSAFGNDFVEQVKVELPKKPANARATKLPPGWTMKRDGKRLVFNGPASPDGRPLRFGVDLGGTATPTTAKVECLANGKTVHKGAQKVTSLPPAGPPETPKQAMSLPPAVSAGQEVTFRLRDAALPPWGSWSIGGVEAGRVSGLEPPTWSFTAPDGWAAGAELTASYTDPWGEELVAGETGTTVVEPPRTIPSRPEITDATLRILAGGSLCVCGWFPTPEARGGILLNGEPLGEPASASPEVLIFFPDKTPPGACTLTGRPDAGFGSSDQATTTLVGVGGSIDRNTLLRGESTPLQLRIVGTEEPLTLRLKNETPGIIRIDGGVEQDVTTSGGAPNVVTRNVKGLVPGDFNITYVLDGSDCPCAEGSLPRAAGPATPAGATR
jgi:hypothetical protein